LRPRPKTETIAGIDAGSRGMSTDMSGGSHILSITRRKAQISANAVAAFLFAWAAHADPADQKKRTLGAEASCPIIEEAARAHQVPVSLLTRLIWNESRFQVAAVSRVGAEGIAQFMPETADERGLANPLNPEQAIPEAAKLLAELGRRFGNLGLAIAAYNAGSGRVASWLNGAVNLPRETRILVRAVTGRSADLWAVSGEYVHAGIAGQSCTALRIMFRDFRFKDANLHTSSALRGMEHSGDILPILRESGRMLPGMEQSGHILPLLRDSGRPLNGKAQSGRMLRVLRTAGPAG
jgi:transglycosylase-like protein with SLT domain